MSSLFLLREKARLWRKKLREIIESQFGEEYAHFLKLMGAIRKKLLRQSRQPGAHKHIFNNLIDNGLLEMIRAGRKKDIDRLLRDTLGKGFEYDSLVNLDS